MLSWLLRLPSYKSPTRQVRHVRSDTSGPIANESWKLDRLFASIKSISVGFSKVYKHFGSFIRFFFNSYDLQNDCTHVSLIPILKSPSNKLFSYYEEHRSKLHFNTSRRGFCCFSEDYMNSSVASLFTETKFNVKNLKFKENVFPYKNHDSFTEFVLIQPKCEIYPGKELMEKSFPVLFQR